MQYFTLVRPFHPGEAFLHFIFHYCSLLSFVLELMFPTDTSCWDSISPVPVDSGTLSKESTDAKGNL